MWDLVVSLLFLVSSFVIHFVPAFPFASASALAAERRLARVPVSSLGVFHSFSLDLVLYAVSISCCVVISSDCFVFTL